MLRGRCSCAISGRPTASSFVFSSLLRPLTPLVPLDASHSPASPLFPLLTQKQGVYPPSNMINRSISEFSLALSSASPLFSVFSLRSSAHSAPLRYLFFCHCLPVLHGASTFLSGISAPNCQFSAINDKSANITLPLSIILSNIVGAPTFSFLHAIERLQPPPAPEGGPFTSFELSTGHPAKDAHPERAARAEGSLQSLATNSNHSRTYARVARKSNHSRTYAKTGGWGVHLAKCVLP